MTRLHQDSKHIFNFRRPVCRFRPVPSEPAPSITITLSPTECAMITGSLLSTAVTLGRAHNIVMRLVAIAERILDAQADAEQWPC